MGYCMELVDWDFEIKADKKESAFKAVKKLIAKLNRRKYYSPYQIKSDLFDTVVGLDWELQEDDKGNINAAVFLGEKLGDDDMLFAALAPFVTKGSYIQMSGGDGGCWRWIFDGKKCKEKHAKVSW